jgi:hypothetical protein
MWMKILAVAFLGLSVMVSGCNAERLVEHSSGKHDPQSVNYPPENALQYPEDQVVKKQFEVTTNWQTITFEKPLQVNRQDLQHLHLAADQQPYISTTDDDPRNLNCSDAEYQNNAFSLRRRSDGALVRPEVILVGDNGVEVKVRPVGHLYPYFDKNIVTIMMGTFILNNHPPPFPKGITAFKAMRIRSTEPFLVRYLYWNVDYHSYYN